MNPISLNKVYEDYKKGLLEKKDIETLIYQQIVKNLDKINFKPLRPEEYEDFTSWIYPRISNGIDSYVNTGATFESFINSIIRLSAKEFRMQITRRGITEYAAWSARIPELYAYENYPAYSSYEYSCEEKDGKTADKRALSKIAAGFKKKRNNPRQLLTLILKCYSLVSDDFLERISSITGIDLEELKTLVENMRSLRRKRDDELYKKRENIYCQFYRCIIYEKQLSLMDKDSSYAYLMKKRLKSARKRLNVMRKRYASIRHDATNSEVAAIMGISKGTVDSSLHVLKAKYNINIDESILN
jgi:hypothetical protein